MTTYAATGSVVLGGSPTSVSLAGPVPEGRAYALLKVVLTGGDSSGQVQIVDDQTPIPNVGFNAQVVTDAPLEDDGEGYHFQAGRTISLVAPEGVGTLYYTIVFRLI